MSIEETLAERGSRYGEFKEHARITQEIKAALCSGRSWNDCTDSQREALEMLAHKMGRIVNGDPKFVESWRDMSGYVRLVEIELSTMDGATDGEVQYKKFSEGGWVHV